MDLYPMRETVPRIKGTACLTVGFLDSPVRDARRHGACGRLTQNGRLDVTVDSRAHARGRTTAVGWMRRRLESQMGYGTGKALRTRQEGHAGRGIIMNRLILCLLVTLIIACRIGLLLMSIWYGWKAVTLGLIPGSLGPFILYGAVSIATGWAGLSKVDLHVKRTNE